MGPDKAFSGFMDCRPSGLRFTAQSVLIGNPLNRGKKGLGLRVIGFRLLLGGFETGIWSLRCHLLLSCRV